jgi:serine/threonine protein kinase
MAKARPVQRVPLDWPTRLIVAVGAAQGLCYMHHHCSPAIIHRDVKTSNILLDSEFRAKVADFGLARMLMQAGEPNTMTWVVGSFGYMAPGKDLVFVIPMDFSRFVGFCTVMTDMVTAVVNTTG